MTDLELLIREAWKAVALEMGDAFLEMSWLCAPAEMSAADDQEEMPLAA